MQYKITIGRKVADSRGPSRQPQTTMQIVKACILTLLVLSVIIGLFLAAFIIGSVIASVLLILVGLSLLLFLVRRLFQKFAQNLKN
jgi:protein-S-isoprenylcysteine O-methyltransferase Ste14